MATPSPLAQAAHNGHDMIVRACLASGTDPNGSYEGGGCALLYAMGSVHPLAQRLPGAASVEKVLACVEILLEAGALPDGPAQIWGSPQTPLMKAIEQNRPAFARAFIRAGACLNVQFAGESLLWTATRLGNQGYACVEILLNAGAADRDVRFEEAIRYPTERSRLWPLFLRAGSDVPESRRELQWGSPVLEYGPTPRLRTPEDVKKYEYLRIVESCGGFKAYEKAHTQALATTFAKKFPFIPEEIFPHIVAFWAHAGFYESAAAVRVIAEERFRKMSGKELIDEFERRKDTMTPEQLEKVRKSCGVYLRRRGEIVDSDESDSEEELYVRLRGLVG